jgi:gas vesicle protein
MIRFLFGFILGLVVGVGGGAMLAPTSGREARERLKGALEQPAAEEAGEGAPAPRSLWQALRQRLAEAAQAAAEAAREVEEEMRARHKELVKRGEK